jgi:hypothetical protein
METTNIYVLIDPQTNLVRYVGKANNVPQRYKAHLNIARKHQAHKLNWINSLKNKGLKPIIEIVDIVPIQEWVFWETYWISQFKTWGFDLINYTEGGDGSTFGNQTSFKKGQKPWNIGLGNFKKCPVCLKEFSSPKSSTQVTCSIDCSKGVKKCSTTSFYEGHKPWNKGLVGKKIKPNKNVYQFNKEKTIMLKKWNTAKEAGDTLNINIEGIGQCARGTAKSCGGFYWNYKNILL